MDSEEKMTMSSNDSGMARQEAGRTPIRLQVVMNDADFNRLWHSAQEWHNLEDDNTGGGWKHQIRAGRFTVAHGNPGTWPSLAWKWSYWFDQDYASVILASSYLTARGHEFQVVLDESENGEWAILTNYEVQPA
jgi:hypothetical protein